MLGFSKIRLLLAPFKCNVQDISRLKSLQRDYLFPAALKFTRTLSNQVSIPSAIEKQKPLSRNDELVVTRDTINCVNEHIKSGNEGRLFAVVHICGKQFKITPEDIIIIEGYWPPQIGDEIKLEKVLLVGGLNFTLIGRPILPQDIVTVKATVIEKDLSHTKTIFYKRKRKQYERINFFRSQFTMLRINEVSVKGNINEHKRTSQYERI